MICFRPADFAAVYVSDNGMGWSVAKATLFQLEASQQLINIEVIQAFGFVRRKFLWPLIADYSIFE